MRFRSVVCWMGAMLAGACAAAQSTDALNLIPYPKEVVQESGAFSLSQPLAVAASEKWLGLVGPMVRDEFTRAGLTPPRLEATKGKRFEIALLPISQIPVKAKRFDIDFTPWNAQRDEFAPSVSEGDEAYRLSVLPERVVVKANAAAGLMYGVQTLVQLLRANRVENTIPCVKIADRPGRLAWRAYQDDLTRIPSSTFETLRRGIDLGAYFKLNVFTYYMESQFAFKKHPIIGPTDGAITPEELKALVAYAAPRHVNILGNQQSFGHMERVLCYDEYKPLAETSWILNPTVEATYEFLDDLYSEEMPLLPFPYFNVCCDETQGLGTGPAKSVVDEKGVGAVYAQHIVRVHDLIVNRYGKRMMMWGDIVLQHPETLNMIPKDTLMLTWGYEPADSYEGQILPFVKAGYEFVVCPSVRNFGRILPDFRGATINIQNFTRDGAKHGAWGVINTAWDDGGRTLNAPNWHGIAWGAECAWNDGETPADVFNRRVGKVLFGEKEDHFGRAIEALAGLQDIPMTAWASDSRFWQDPLAGEVKFASIDQVRTEAAQVLAIVGASRPEFEACRAQATANRDLLDYFVFGLKRYEVMAQAAIDLADVSAKYTEAGMRGPTAADPLLAQCQALLEKTSNAYRELQRQEWELYLRENKPYGADFRYKAYQTKFIDRYTAIAQGLQTVRTDATSGKALPDAKTARVELVSAK